MTTFSRVTKHPATEYFLLALITLFAAGLRLYQLGVWSFWGDEVFSIGVRDDGFLPSTTTGLIHWTIARLGTSEWSARIAPATIGWLSIPVLYFLFRSLLGTWAALIAVALLAVSPWHLYWSQNAQFYVLLLLFYTLALMFILIVLAYLALVVLLPFKRPAGLRWRNLALFFLPILGLALFFAGPYVRNWAGWLQAITRINTNPTWLLAGTVYYIGCQSSSSLHLVRFISWLAKNVPLCISV